MLSSHKIDFKLYDSEMGDSGETMSTDVITLKTLTEKFRSQREQLRGLQGTVLLDFIRNVISTILLALCCEFGEE